MHLGALQEMLAFFAANSHKNYTKSVWLYLRKMHGRDKTNLRLLPKFLEVYHVLRRRDKKKWEGLFIHLMNEEVLIS